MSMSISSYVNSLIDRQTQPISNIIDTGAPCEKALRAVHTVRSRLLCFLSQEMGCVRFNISVPMMYFYNDSKSHKSISYEKSQSQTHHLNSPLRIVNTVRFFIYLQVRYD